MTHLDAQKLIVQPAVPVQLTTTAENQHHLQWPQTNSRATIYRRPLNSTADANQELTTTSENKITLPKPETNALVLYTIKTDNGRIWHLAERYITLEHSINFRDIGGYKTSDGRQTVWGQVYRSGELGDLSAADWARFTQLNINTILDLRTSSEVSNKGENLPPHLTHLYRHRPIYERTNHSKDLIATLVFNKSQIEKMWLEEFYIGRFITSHAQAFGNILKEIASDAQRPTLIHCTAGKDRTGVSIALLLHILGVPRETIIAEYTLSNIDYQRLHKSIEKDRRRMAVFGIKTKHLFPILTANQHVLRQTFNHIDNSYGSIDNYLHDVCQLPPESCAHLRNSLTTAT